MIIESRSDSYFLRIQSKNFRIEHGSEGNPGCIRNERIPSRSIYLTCGLNVGKDRTLQRKHVEQGKRCTMLAEEQLRPFRIGGKLRDP